MFFKIFFVCVAIGVATAAVYRDLYIIRSHLSPVVPMVLRADTVSKRNVYLDVYTGDASELWRFVKGNQPGLFFIINRALDNYTLAADDPSTTLHVDPMNDDEFVYANQWFITDEGLLVSPYKKYVTATIEITNLMGTNLTVTETLRPGARGQIFFFTKTDWY